jgi:hypothetical protein
MKQKKFTAQLGSVKTRPGWRGVADAVCTRLSSFAQWLGPEEGQQRRVELPEMSKRDPSQEGLWGQNRTEPAAGWPPRGSGRHPGQQGRVPKEELPACSAADHLNGLPVAVIDESQVARLVPAVKHCRPALRGGMVSLALMPKVWHTMPQSAEACSQLLRASESRHGSTWKPERAQSSNRANPNLAKQAGRACAMGSKHPATSSAALALQASLPRAETWSCLTPTSPIDELSSGASSVAPHNSEMELKTSNKP